MCHSCQRDPVKQSASIRQSYRNCHLFYFYSAICPFSLEPEGEQSTRIRKSVSDTHSHHEGYSESGQHVFFSCLHSPEYIDSHPPPALYASVSLLFYETAARWALAVQTPWDKGQGKVKRLHMRGCWTWIRWLSDVGRWNPCLITGSKGSPLCVSALQQFQIPPATLIVSSKKALDEFESDFFYFALCIECEEWSEK